MTFVPAYLGNISPCTYTIRKKKAIFADIFRNELNNYIHYGKFFT